ncbi:MAG: Signal peptidase I [Rhodanobacteraceae bacterium]|nr:MAG: Signal peptidase I [Rhodanobacteraceae bacterium]
MKKDALGTVVLVAIVAICIYIWYKTSDFALALVLITAAFFVVWLGDKLLFARRRRERAASEGQKPHEPVLVDYARSFFPVILAVLLFRTFLLEPFRIPSGSMMPTLLVGDFVLVNKFAYGLRLPVTNTRILGALDSGEPQRGDIAVFRYPLNPKEDYIKRIIGLPGDTVTVKGEQVSINGKPLPQTLIGPYRGTDKVSIQMQENPMMSPVTLHEEELAGVKHQILQFGYIEPYNCTGSGGEALPDGGCRWTVPAGHYFAMGDNRDDSEDSRFWGFVPEGNLAGKAFFIWFSLADWHRIGTVLH